MPKFHHNVGSRGGPGGWRGEAAGVGAKVRTTLAEPSRWRLGEARVEGWGGARTSASVRRKTTVAGWSRVARAPRARDQCRFIAVLL